MITTLLFILMTGQIKTVEPHNPWDIEIVVKKVQEYYLLTRHEPISMTVEGPTSIRVYTRILLPDQHHGDYQYKLILTEGPLDERILSFETEASTITSDKNGTTVSKWRSFYIDVPVGEKTYTLTHWASPKDTILLKFAYESPAPWTIVSPTTHTATLETIEQGTTTRYYELEKSNLLKVTVSGPTRLRVTTRLNYDETLFGEQSFTLIAGVDGQEMTFPLKCERSDDLYYNNRNDIVPSNARTVYIPLEQGTHTLVFTISGTLAKSIALRFEKAPE